MDYRSLYRKLLARLSKSRLDEAVRSEKASHPKNVPGDFYVTDGCCNACGIPVTLAPELFAWDGTTHCFVKHQPKTETSVDNALRVLKAAESRCVRYRGTDPQVMQRIADIGEIELCDSPTRRRYQPVLRDHVTFENAPPANLTVLQLATGFQDFLRASRMPKYDVRPIHVNDNVASFTFSWIREEQHRVIFTGIPNFGRGWLVRHKGNLAVSDLLHDWITSDRRFSNARWYSTASFRGDKIWNDTPW